MSRDRKLGAVFAALGAAVFAGAWALPGGSAGVPGPGFFPLGIGLVLTALGLAALAGAGGGARTAAAAAPADWRATGAVAALLAVYLLLWGTGWFALRTVVFLAVLLRLLGQGWRPSAGVAATLTAAVVAAFQWGLNISLD